MFWGVCASPGVVFSVSEAPPQERGFACFYVFFSPPKERAFFLLLNYTLVFPAKCFALMCLQR
uniref:Uncharacterized protein n=1 Tax=Escherichia coli TaxID=562 RepID=A0A7L8KA66_ECOLX|nr:hypothetical protein [Escherichia coli]